MKQRTTIWGATALMGMALSAMSAPQEVVPTVEIPTVVVQEGPQTPDTQGARAIDMVICLDTSGSMSGLLDSCRQKLWSIVNDLALAKPTPRLRVSLLTFGNDGHRAEEGWVFIQTPFTEDLDLVSQKLFEQTTNGGTELVGRVMKKALDHLQFDPSPDTLKLMFVAGNESADQDQEVNFRDMSSSAISRGIMVNTIYCGNPADELAPAWKEVAMRADGHFASIDQNNGTVVIETPFDEELAALSAGINGTYVPLGEAGRMGCENQWVQDSNVAGLNSAAVAGRAQTKGGKLYKVDWDLANLANDKKVDLTKIKKEDLPEVMQTMTLVEQQAYLDQKLAEREVIQKKIEGASLKRQAFVQEELKKRAIQSNDSFDFAVRRAIRSQATTKGFEFEKLPELPPQVETPVQENDVIPTLQQAAGQQVVAPPVQQIGVNGQNRVQQGQVLPPPVPPTQQGQGGQVQGQSGQQGQTDQKQQVEEKKQSDQKKQSGQGSAGQGTSGSSGTGGSA